MQRTIWEWLGIEKTTDKSRIKKAYAEQVKKYHPEEFPEEAQELRKAYKDAMALASAARNVPGRAADDIVQGTPLAARNPGEALTESSQPEPDARAERGYAYANPVMPGSQPEPDTKGERGYAYANSVMPGSQPEPDAKGERGYAYANPVMPGSQPEPDAKAERGYAYANPVMPGSQPEPDAKGERGYAYANPALPGSQPEPDAKGERGYVYTKSVLPDMQPEPDSEPEYSFVNPELPHGMAMRINDLKKRMEEIYSTDHRNFAEKWRRVFIEYPYPRDLRDIRAVWEIFTVIEPMTRLNDSTWEILQTELFRFREDTASWQLLQERFTAVRRSYEIPATMPASVPPKKTSLTEFCAVFLIVAILIGLPAWARDEAQEWKQHLKLLEYRQLISEQIQLENSAIPISRGALQTVYTKESPYEMDLNQDEMTDHIYYDPNKGLFMVELYNASTYTYKLYGSMDQYLEENPELYSIKSLSYFTGGGY